MTDNLIVIINNIDWSSVALTVTGFLAAGGGLSAFIELLKRVRKWESGAFIQLMLGVWTLLAAVAEYIVTNTNAADPLARLFGSLWPSLFLSAVVMHRAAISPVSRLIVAKLAERKDFKETVRAYRAEKEAKSVDQPEQFN